MPVQIALAVTVGTTNLVNSMAMGFSSPAIVLLRQDPSMKVSEEEVRTSSFTLHIRTKI